MEKEFAMLLSRITCRLIPVLENGHGGNGRGRGKRKRKEKLSNLSTRLPFVDSECSFFFFILF